MATSPPENELQSIAPVLKKTLTNEKGETVEVTKIKVRQLLPVFEAMAPIGKYFKGKKGLEDLDLLDLATKHLDDMINLLSVVVQKDKKWLEDQDVDFLLDLFGTALEVNLDFFIHRVLPSLSATVVKASSVVVSAQTLHGLKQSTPLSPTVTDSAKS